MLYKNTMLFPNAAVPTSPIYWESLFTNSIAYRHALIFKVYSICLEYFVGLLMGDPLHKSCGQYPTPYDGVPWARPTEITVGVHINDQSLQERLLI